MSPARANRLSRRSAVTATAKRGGLVMPSWGWPDEKEVVVYGSFGSGKSASSLAVLERISSDASVTAARKDTDLRFLNTVVEAKSKSRSKNAGFNKFDVPILPSWQPKPSVGTHVGEDVGDEALLLVSVANSYRTAQRAAEGGIRNPTRVDQDLRLDVATKWEGVVLDLCEDSFLARLTDETGRQPEVEAEILVSEVSPADRDLLRKRAVFYWVMGYRDTPEGDRVRASRLRFRRLPGWRPEDLAEAEQWAEKVRSELGWG